MSQHPKHKKKDSYGLGLLVFCLVYLGVGMLVIRCVFYPEPRSIRDHIHVSLRTPGAQVPLWKHPPRPIEVAAITPACATHDWSCVLGESTITEAYAQ